MDSKEDERDYTTPLALGAAAGGFKAPILVKMVKDKKKGKPKDHKLSEMLKNTELDLPMKANSKSENLKTPTGTTKSPKGKSLSALHEQKKAWWKHPDMAEGDRISDKAVKDIDSTWEDLRKKKFIGATDKQLGDRSKDLHYSSNDPGRLEQLMEVEKEIEGRGYKPEFKERPELDRSRPYNYRRGIKKLKGIGPLAWLTGAAGLVLPENSKASEILNFDSATEVGYDPAIEDPASLEYQKEMNARRLVEALKKRRGK